MFVFIPKMNFILFFLTYQHNPANGQRYKISTEQSSCNKPAGGQRGPTGQHSGTRSGYTQVPCFYTFTRELRHPEKLSQHRETKPAPLLHPLPPSTGPCREMRHAAVDISPERTRIRDGIKY